MTESDQIAATARLNPHSAGEQGARIEPADVVQPQEAFIVDVLDVESDLIHVALQCCPQQRILVREILVERADRNPGAGCDARCCQALFPDLQ